MIWTPIALAVHLSHWRRKERREGTTIEREMKFCGVVKSRYASVLLHEVNYWNGSVTHHDFVFILHLKLKWREDLELAVFQCSAPSLRFPTSNEEHMQISNTGIFMKLRSIPPFVTPFQRWNLDVFGGLGSGVVLP